MNDQIKLNNSETRIMNVLWEKGQLPAKEVALEAACLLYTSPSPRD